MRRTGVDRYFKETQVGEAEGQRRISFVCSQDEDDWMQWAALACYHYGAADGV